jgi:hypothetical protein
MTNRNGFLQTFFCKILGAKRYYLPRKEPKRYYFSKNVLKHTIFAGNGYGPGHELTLSPLRTPMPRSCGYTGGCVYETLQRRTLKKVEKKKLLT